MNLWTNYIKTVILLGGLSSLLVVLGGGLYGQNGAISFFFISLAINFFTYWFSDRMALASAGAKQVEQKDIPNLYPDIENMASMNGLPMPRIYISPSTQPNAFATGRNPENAAVCLNQGLLNTLTKDEIMAVVAHELGHIKNRDILIGTIAASVAGAITFMARSAGYFGGGRDREGNSNPIVIIIAMIVAPIAALILQMAISRSREYKADEFAARAQQTGQHLVTALQKISGMVPSSSKDNISESYASMYIANPFNKGDLTALFSTHPPVHERLKKLEEFDFNGI